MNWTEPYRGLPWTATGVGDNPPDAADVLAARSKRGGNMVKVPMGVLVGMASRLDSQSRALVAAQGGLGASLGPADLAAYTAAQEAAAERAAAKVGVLVHGGADNYAMYDNAGRFVAHNNGDTGRYDELVDGWNYAILALPTLNIGLGGPGWPETLHGAQRAARHG